MKVAEGHCVVGEDVGGEDSEDVLETGTYFISFKVEKNKFSCLRWIVLVYHSAPVVC